MGIMGNIDPAAAIADACAHTAQDCDGVVVSDNLAVVVSDASCTVWKSDFGARLMRFDGFLDARRGETVRNRLDQL